MTAVACAERTLAANGLANAQVRLGDGVMGLASESFDLVLSHLPREWIVQEELIQGAAWALGPGGRFCLVAGTRAGCSASAPSCARRRAITFAWDRLDEGTAVLVGAMEIGAGDCVLDLGCGTGLAGLAAARRAAEGRVVLVDADVRAVESTHRTLAANAITHAEVLLSDCAFAVFDRQFDVVITNPPFHQGVGVDYEVARQFVRDAARVLRRGGRLFLVANRFLRYADLIRETFGAVGVAYVDNRYHVLTAVAQKATSG